MAKAKVSGTVVVLVAALVLAVMFVVGRCVLRCGDSTEGYRRSCLGGDCSFQRSPVDHANAFGIAPTVGWESNPHYQADPSNEHQPLGYGPVDLEEDLRKVGSGEMYAQYRNDWRGCGGQDGVMEPNDEKTRFDLENAGDHQQRVMLDNEYHPRHGPSGVNHTELAYQQHSGYDTAYWPRHMLQDQHGD